VSPARKWGADDNILIFRKGTSIEEAAVMLMSRPQSVELELPSLSEKGQAQVLLAKLGLLDEK
jgi:hypothetical protein